MRKFFLRAARFTISLVTLGDAFITFIAQMRPFCSGNIGFPMPYLAEYQSPKLTNDLVSRAHYTLSL